jgi:hypothetical protein
MNIVAVTIIQNGIVPATIDKEFSNGDLKNILPNPLDCATTIYTA